MVKYAVIVAGGTGTRMGTPTPKQFLEINGRPILYYSIRAFLDAFEDLRVILVLPAGHMQQENAVTRHFRDATRIQVTAGGDTRFGSVKNGLALVKEESVVFVHDGVRCLLSAGLIHRCYEKAMETGSAIPVVPSKDSVRLLSETGNQAIDRNNVMLVQTPQTFRSRILLPAYDVAYRESFTDEATVVETSGYSVSLVPGEETNIKITRPGDLKLAESILNGEC